MTIALQLAVLLSSLGILSIAGPALNLMSPCTPYVAKLAFWLLTSGAAAAGGSVVLLGAEPDVPQSMTTTGVALLLAYYRWRPRPPGDRRKSSM